MGKLIEVYIPASFPLRPASSFLPSERADVLGIIHNGPIPKRGGGRSWLEEK